MADKPGYFVAALKIGEDAISDRSVDPIAVEEALHTAEPGFSIFGVGVVIALVAIALVAGAVRQFRMRRILPAVSGQQPAGSATSRSPRDNVSRTRSGNSTEIYCGSSSCDVDTCDSFNILNSQGQVLESDSCPPHPCRRVNALTLPGSECSASALPWKLISHSASTDSKPCAWHVASASLVHVSGKCDSSAALRSHVVTRADGWKEDVVSDFIFLRRRSSSWDHAALLLK